MPRKGPPPPSSLYRLAEKKYGLPPGLLHGIAMVESRENPYARSPTGVVGLMGITRRTGKEVGMKERDRTNPVRQIDLSGQILQKLVKRRHGDVETAVTKYGDPTDPGYTEKVYRFAGLKRRPQTGMSFSPDALDPETSSSTTTTPTTHEDAGFFAALGPNEASAADVRPEDATALRSLHQNRQGIDYATDARFNTALTPHEEQQFQQWKSMRAPHDSGADYDLRGAFKAGLEPGDSGHWSDQFKKPNHPTFSDQSQYAPLAPERAGHWDGDTYIPPGPVDKSTP